MKKAHILRSFLVFLLGIVALLPVRETHAAELSLTTTAPTVTVNERFAVTINLGGNDLTMGTDIVLRYDPTRLIAKTVSEGTIYPTYNPAETARINKDIGIIVLSGSTGVGQSVPANGVFGTISFVALKDGKTNITFEYEPGMTNKTGVISPTGEELLNTKPLPLSITVRRQSFFGALLSFFQSLWKK